MKKCTRCGTVKSELEYYKDKRTSTGLYSECKKCHDTRLRSPLNWLKESPTPEIAARLNIYAIQNRLKTQVSYSNRLLLFTLEELTSFYKKNWETFMKLHGVWKSHGYEYRHRPSLDRINNDGNYSLDNIQIIPIHENIRKDHVGKKFSTIHKLRMSESSSNKKIDRQRQEQLPDLLKEHSPYKIAKMWGVAPAAVHYWIKKSHSSQP